MKAFVFPGQGAQYTGMGKDLYDNYTVARQYMNRANELLGFSLTDIMFEGDSDDLKETRVTQPAVFLHSVVSSLVNTTMTPDAVAGHSLGEFSALVACGALDFESALKLVSERAQAMQEACEIQESTMAAVLGLPDERVDEICQGLSGHVVVAANYNCPGQVVISGTVEGIEKAGEVLKANGAKRALRLQVGGAFHSPLMKPAAERLSRAIMMTDFRTPRCPIYQNVSALPYTTAADIRENLMLQLTSPVRWTQTVRNMIVDGVDQFYEFGPGDVLKGLIHKINPDVQVF